MGETKKCEWCAEEILLEARKCKHCGELVGTSPPDNAVLPSGSSPPQCSLCTYQPTSSRDFYLHHANVHKGQSATGVKAASTSPKPSYSGRVGKRAKLSTVGSQSDAGLGCPKCGGTQFTAKRSNKGKLIGLTTLGVGGLIAPKSQVKCVTCGTMFKRG